MTTVTAERKMDARIVDLAMTPEDAEELRLVLDSSLADLHREIAHMERYEFREVLKKRRTILHGVPHQLSATPIGATAHERHTEPQ